MDIDDNFEFEVEVEKDFDDKEVRPLAYLASRKREYTVIVDGEGGAWLMLTADVPGDFPFRLTHTELLSLPKPYDFEEEIEEVMPTVADVQRMFWQYGIITKDDLRDVARVRNALGIMPSANSFVKFVGG